MLNKIVRVFGGDPNKRQIDKYTETVESINGLEPAYETYRDEQLLQATADFRRRLAMGETLDEVLPEAFAVVREASKRVLGQRHYDVQLIGGIALHEGRIAEMRTGEGKTLVATLPLYLNALALNPEWVTKAQKKWGEDPSGWEFIPLEELPVGQGVHLITVNDYLARRDARWMGVIYAALGLEVGVLQMAARTENGRKAFVVDFERESPHEDQHNLRMVSRREAYASDITYGTNSEFGFDYLRDNMAMRLEDRVQRGYTYAIIDEVDNVLIDEARTPLIISGPSHDDTEWYLRMTQVVRGLTLEDYEISERDRTVTLTEVGEGHVEDLLGMALRDPERPEDVTPEQARLLGYLEQALRAQFLFKRNKDYLVQAGKVIIVDEFTGRLMPGRRWSDGLHQAVEAKEGAKVQRENVTYATITIQNYFRMYQKLAGMTGTAVTEAEEFNKIYKLEVLAIPTNLEYIASRADTDLIELEDRDEKGYKYSFYADNNDPERSPIFWRRKDYPDVVFRSEEAKLRALSLEILRYNAQGRPILVGTTSVELSERISNRLRAEPVRRMALVALLRDRWMEANGRQEDGRSVPELEYLNVHLEELPMAEMRKMARDLEIAFNPESPENLRRLLAILELSEEDSSRLSALLGSGISHQVLNARKHTEESQIIAGAGAFGAVTIATNMAGRGVDIKLGGDLAEEIVAAISRILRRTGQTDPYDMILEEKREALLALDSADFGIYEQEAKYFLQYMEEMQRVRDLGGLHVIGSERHESRRIDNQLRGRAARQGDPGSSRFYLSMEDELMRLFGGQQAEAMMTRLRIDDAMPIEVGLVGRIVEQSQGRVEGANFDVRKHLLEYDDVLNTQRAKIYDQRNRIFSKDDLSEDVTEMLQAEVNRRVPESLGDPEGPWRLLAWLDQIQPPLTVDGTITPSYPLRLLVEHVMGSEKSAISSQPSAVSGQRSAASDQSSVSGDHHPPGTPPSSPPLGPGVPRGIILHPSSISREAARDALLQLAEDSLKAEEEHLLVSIESLLEASRERFEAQLQERLDAVDTFFEGLGLEEGDGRAPRQMLEELSDLVHLPLKLSTEEQRALRDDPEQVEETLRTQVTGVLVDQSIARLVGAVERRLEEDLELNRSQLPSDWDALSDLILDAIQGGFERRRQRLIGNEGGEGQITRDLDSLLSKGDAPLGALQVLQLLIQMPQGSRATFDKRTHRRVWRRTTRLTYSYAASKLLENRDPEQITQEVLGHLEGAQAAMRFAWGRSEWSRIATARPLDLDETTQRGLERLVGADRYDEIKEQPLQAIPDEERARMIDEMGRQALTEVYRQLLLGVISELWVEYLTSMEALRVSIGLEAYAQRDPLVQYKNRAFSMFRELLDDMRTGVVTRMFTYRPRDLSSVQTTVAGPRAELPVPETTPEAMAVQEGRAASVKSGPGKGGGKSKRRRRRR